MNINSDLKEIKNEKFRQLSEKRINQILDKIRVLSNLGNKSNYEYDQRDIERMFQVIERALKEAKKRFQSDSKKDNYKFKW